MSSDDARSLGPEMTTEGWRVVGGEWVSWFHPPSSRSVCVDSYEWRQCTGIVALHGAPVDPKTAGYVVNCRIHDELGNPVEGTCFWIESYGEAIRRARALRASILAEHAPPPATEQLTLDDALAGGKETAT